MNVWMYVRMNVCGGREVWVGGVGHIFILGRYRYYDDHCTVVIVIEGLPNCCFKKHTFSHMVYTT